MRVWPNLLVGSCDQGKLQDAAKRPSRLRLSLIRPESVLTRTYAALLVGLLPISLRPGNAVKGNSSSLLKFPCQDLFLLRPSILPSLIRSFSRQLGTPVMACTGS